MGEQRVLQVTPGDIGDYSDDTSIARMLLDKIDRISYKLSFLATTFESMSNEDIAMDFRELDGLKAICEDMTNDELFKAHQMICDPHIYRKEAPETEPAKNDPGA